MEKTLMPGKTESRRKGWQRMRWLDVITDSMDMNWVNSKSSWWTGRPGMLQSMGSQSQTQLKRLSTHTICLSKSGSQGPLSFLLHTFSQMSPSQWGFFCCVQSLSHIQHFATLWPAACQTSLSFTVSQTLFKLMSIESVTPAVFCRPLLILPSIFPNIRVFSNESAFRIRWPKY